MIKTEKFKPSVIGTSKNMPVVLSDDADTDPVEIEAANVTGIITLKSLVLISYDNYVL